MSMKTVERSSLPYTKRNIEIKLDIRPKTSVMIELPLKSFKIRIFSTSWYFCESETEFELVICRIFLFFLVKTLIKNKFKTSPNNAPTYLITVDQLTKKIGLKVWNWNFLNAKTQKIVFFSLLCEITWNFHLN